MMSFLKARFKKYRDFLFTQREFLSGSLSGFSLIEVMAAASIVGVLGLAISSMSTTAFKAASISNSRQDLASLQMLIREQVSCPLTLGLPLNHDFSVPVPCAGPYLLQKNSPSGAVQLGATISGDSERTQIGNYKVRASCVANQLQIMVESTRKDPITNTILPPRNLFAGAGGNGLCSQFFTGATCPAGRVVTGVANGIPVCSAAAACPSGQVQTGTTNGVPVCANAGACPAGQVEVGRVNNQAVCATPTPCPAGTATVGVLTNGQPVCSGATTCPANFVWTGWSNGLPVCTYWVGCPAGTINRGSKDPSGQLPVCEVPHSIPPFPPACDKNHEIAWNGSSYYCRYNIAAACLGQGGNAASNVTGWVPALCDAAADQSCSKVSGCVRDSATMPNIAMCAWTCRLSSP